MFLQINYMFYVLSKTVPSASYRINRYYVTFASGLLAAILYFSNDVPSLPYHSDTKFRQYAVGAAFNLWSEISGAEVAILKLC